MGRPPGCDGGQDIILARDGESNSIDCGSGGDVTSCWSTNGPGNDSIHRCQAKARPLALGGKERLEDPLNRLFVHPDPRVAHLEPHVATRLSIGVHVCVLVIEHGVPGLDHQSGAETKYSSEARVWRNTDMLVRPD